MISVLLVDDHDLVRMGFRLLLEQVPDINVVGEADRGETALEQIPGLNPDLVLMDINMPGIGGIEATRKIRHHHPHIQVIAVTAHDDSPFPFQLHEAGALGYLTKGCHADELFTAIRTVSTGKPYISSDVTQKLTVASISGVDHNSPFAELSQREMQILLMIVQGKKNRDISGVLNLSQKTISTYRHRLYEKLKVDNDVELALMAIRHGLVERENI
jgi:two-component system invasion response regulator UvrY